MIKYWFSQALAVRITWGETNLRYMLGNYIAKLSTLLRPCNKLKNHCVTHKQQLRRYGFMYIFRFPYTVFKRATKSR
jgi:hypothetical protein